VAAVCDEEYPRYVAFSALKELLELFTKANGEYWRTATSDKPFPTPGNFDSPSATSSALM